MVLTVTQKKLQKFDALFPPVTSLDSPSLSLVLSEPTSDALPVLGKKAL
jgi:hypothetical protein